MIGSDVCVLSSLKQKKYALIVLLYYYLAEFTQSFANIVCQLSLEIITSLI